MIGCSDMKRLEPALRLWEEFSPCFDIDKKEDAYSKHIDVIFCLEGTSAANLHQARDMLQTFVKGTILVCVCVFLL